MLRVMGIKLGYCLGPAAARANIGLIHLANKRLRLDAGEFAQLMEDKAIVHVVALPPVN